MGSSMSTSHSYVECFLEVEEHLIEHANCWDLFSMGIPILQGPSRLLEQLAFVDCAEKRKVQDGSVRACPLSV